MSEWVRIERARWEELDETARRLARISTDQKAELDECKRREVHHEATARSLDHLIRLRDEELAAMRADRGRLADDVGSLEDRLQEVRAENATLVKALAHERVRNGELRARVAALETTIERHNEGCEEACEWRKSHGHCTGYVERDMRCMDCPNDNVIELPVPERGA